MVEESDTDSDLDSEQRFQRGLEREEVMREHRKKQKTKNKAKRIKDEHGIDLLQDQDEEYTGGKYVSAAVLLE